MKKFPMFLGALAFLVSASAFAQTVPMADRGVTLNKGQGEIGLDFTIGLDKGMVGDFMGIYTGFVGDHYSGLSFGYGVIDNLEVGLAIDAMRKTPAGTDFGGAKLYGKYAFIPNLLGAELGIILPGKDFSNRRLALDIGVPFQYIAVPGLLKVYLRPDFVLDFSKFYDDLGFFLNADLGAIVSITPEFFAQLGFGISKCLKPSGGNVTLPLGILLGYTVIPQLDLALSFNFTDLKGAKADARNLAIHAAFRF